MTSKPLKVDVNVPFLFFLSILPDIDLLIPGLIHHGPTHSIVIYCVLFLPFFLVFGKKTLPSFIAIVQHLLGDFVTSRWIMILWPLTQEKYGMGICMRSPQNISLEWAGFLVSFAIMYKTKDVWKLLKPHKSNWILLLPIAGMFASMFLGVSYPVPKELLIPHLTLLTIFVSSILVDLGSSLNYPGLKPWGLCYEFG